MSDRKIKHIGALAVWGILQGYFLAYRFSWANFVLYLALLVFLYCTTVAGRRNEQRDVVDTLGNLLGASFAAMLGYYIIADIAPLFRLPEGVEPAEILPALGYRFTSQIQESALTLGFDEEKAVWVLGLLVACFLIGRGKKDKPIGVLTRYLFTAVLFGWFIHGLYESMQLLVLYLAVTLLFVICDVLALKQSDFVYKAGKRWFNILNILLFLALLLDPWALLDFTREGFLEYYFITCGFKWYTALLILVALVVGLVTACVGFESNKAATYTDVALFWNAICLLLALFFMSRFYVGYWWLVALVYAVGVGIAAIKMHPCELHQDDWLNGILVMAGISLAVIITVVAGHFGRLLITWLLVGGALLVWDQQLRRDESDEWWKDARFYTLVLVCVAAAAAAGLWGFRRSVFYALVLAGMLAVCLAFVWITSRDSGMFDKKSQLLQIAAVAVFAVLCLSLCNKNGAKIKIGPDDTGEVIVEIEAKGKENQIQTVEYYWLESFLQLEEGDDFPREVQLPSGRIPDGDGRLRVIVTDASGIQTEQIYWIHEPLYSE